MPSRRRRLLVSLSLLLLAGGGFAVYRFVSAKHADVLAAEVALAQRDFKAASEHLDRYITTHPDDTDARLLAAQAARRAGDFAAADTHLRRCEGGPDLNGGIARERRFLKVQQGDWRDAAVLAASAADDDGPDAALACEAAILGTLAALSPEGTDDVLVAEAGPYLTAARRATDRWLVLRTGREDQAAGLVWRGRISDLGGDHPAALTDFRRALEVDPNSTDAMFFLAVGVSQANPPEAVALLSALRERRPGDTRVAFALANSYRAVGRLDDAGKLLDGLLQADPANVSALLWRGKVLLDAGQPEKAEPYLLRALELRPNLPLTHLNLSQCMQLLGRPEQAKKYQDRFVQLDAEQNRPTTAPKP